MKLIVVIILINALVRQTCFCRFHQGIFKTLQDLCTSLEQCGVPCGVYYIDCVCGRFNHHTETTNCQLKSFIELDMNQFFSRCYDLCFCFVLTLVFVMLFSLRNTQKKKSATLLQHVVSHPSSKVTVQ